MAGEINFGLLDPNLPAKVANSFYEGQQQQKQNRLSDLQMQGAQSQNDMARYNLAKAARDDASQNALSEAYKSAFDPATGQVNEQALYKGLAERGAGHLIPAAQASVWKFKVEQGNYNKTKAETDASEFKLKTEKKHQAITDISALKSPEEAIASIDQHVLNGDINAEQAQMIKQGIPQDSSKFQEWQFNMVKGILSPQDAMKYSTPDANAMLGAKTAQSNLALESANKPFVVGETGQPVPNLPVQKFEMGKSRAGASNTSIKIDNKTGEGIAKEVGPMVAASKASAEGAIQQIDTANRLNSAIDSGKLIAGPGANARIALSQIANVLGVGGSNNNEILANTRAAVQGLAKFSLDGRSALKGQGQISDYEGKLLAKATSGDISDLTLPELKVLTGTAQRVATAQYATHQRNMNTMRSKPSLQDVADFYDVPPLPSAQSAQPAPSAPSTPSGFKILKVH